MSRWLFAVPLLALGALIAGCGGDNDSVDLPGGGEVSVSDDLPDDFPDDFPKYDGAKIMGSYSGDQDGQQGFFVTWETDDSADDVKDFYTNEFESGPWKSTGNFSSGDTSVISAEHDDGTAAAVSISEVDGKTTISVFLGNDTTSSSGDDDSSDDSGSDDENTPDNSDSSSSNDDGTSGDDSSSGDSSGSSELPDEVDLEDAYPEDKIPLPSGARVTSSSAFTSGGNSTVFVELYVEQTPDELKDYYKQTMEANGYTESFSSSSGGESFLSYAEGDGTSGNAAIITIADSDVDGYSTVSISLTNAESP